MLIRFALVSHISQDLGQHVPSRPPLAAFQRVRHRRLLSASISLRHGLVQPYGGRFSGRDPAPIGDSDGRVHCPRDTAAKMLPYDHDPHPEWVRFRSARNTGFGQGGQYPAVVAGAPQRRLPCWKGRPIQISGGPLVPGTVRQVGHRGSGCATLCHAAANMHDVCWRDISLVRLLT